jgi:hypothetical protein
MGQRAGRPNRIRARPGSRAASESRDYPGGLRWCRRSERGSGRAGGTGDDDAGVFERLAQSFEHPLGELRQLVQKRTTRIR